MISLKDIEVIKENYHSRDHNNDYSKNNLGFGMIHYSMIRNLRPEMILVVGSQKGYIPAICALACKHEDKGVVHFVDAGFGIDDKHSWGGIGVWKKASKDYWKPLTVENYIRVFCMTTDEFAEKLKELPVFYSYIYIDGDHSYEGVRRDYELFWEYLSPGGLMVFHDVLVDKMTAYGRCGVKRFWNEVKGEHPSITINQSAGLGIMEKEWK